MPKKDMAKNASYSLGVLYAYGKKIFFVNVYLLLNCKPNISFLRFVSNPENRIRAWKINKNLSESMQTKQNKLKYKYDVLSLFIR